MKVKSALYEMGAWLLLAAAALILALPLAMWEHGFPLERLLPGLEFLDESQPETDGPALSGFDFDDEILWSGVVSDRLETMKLQAQASAQSKAAWLEMAALAPEPLLLVEVSQSQRSARSGSKSSAYDLMITKAARQHHVSPALVKAVMQVESNFNPNAVSGSGALGLMQVMPGTARAMGVSDPMDPQKNVTAGVKYLKMLLNMYNDDERLAVAAYNCGPEVLKRFGNQPPPYRETQAFIERVMRYYNIYLES